MTDRRIGFSAMAGRVTLLGALCFALPAGAGVLTTIEVTADDRVNGTHHSFVHQCTVSVCTLPGGPTPLPIPFPQIAHGATVDATDGRLRGTARIEGGDDVAGTLTTLVSFFTQGPVIVVPGAPILHIEGMQAVVTANLHMSNKAAARCGHSECGNGGSVSTKVKLLSQNDGDLGQGIDRSHGVGAGVFNEQEFSETMTASLEVSDFISIGWEFETGLNVAGIDEVAENDFSSTLQFESLRFYDVDGNDVTQWVRVAWEDPIYFAQDAVVPEPATIALLAGPLAGLLAFTRRRRTRAGAPAGK